LHSYKVTSRFFKNFIFKNFALNKIVHLKSQKIIKISMKKLLLASAFSLSFGVAPIAIYAQKNMTEAPVFVSNTEGIKEYTLKNGLKVLLIPDASQSNMVVNIVYNVGSRHEGYGEKGMAHLLEHMLFKSTKKLGDIKKTII